jgi:PIN domain nuclease of toxin-antitoxin system
MDGKDPDDSMIVSQVFAEQIPVAIADSAFGSYAVTTLW